MRMMRQWIKNKVNKGLWAVSFDEKRTDLYKYNANLNATVASRWEYVLRIPSVS